MSDRWTLYQDPTHDNDVLFIGKGRCFEPGETVEVCPVAELEAVSSWLTTAQKCHEEVQAELDALRKDYDRFPEFVREVACTLRSLEAAGTAARGSLGALADRLDPPPSPPCKRCGGEGYVERTVPEPDHFPDFKMRVICPDCASSEVTDRDVNERIRNE